MNGDDVSEFLYQPGRLVAAPTNLAAAFPYGGESLGFLEEGLRWTEEWHWLAVRHRARQHPHAGLRLGLRRAAARAKLMQVAHFNRLLEAGWLSSGVPALTSSAAVVGVVTGYKLLFAPEDTTQGKVFVLWNAVPKVLSPSVHRRQERTLLEVEWEGLEDSTGRVYTGPAPIDSVTL